MVREGLARRRVGGAEEFRWRGGDVWRMEGFSDAVFAFAVTLLVVSLEVPRTFDELLAAMRGFLAFAICFALLLFVWYEHYKFCRRYGLKDIPTVWLNSALLFVVLFYVYPLKFLFTLLVSQLLGSGQEVRLPSGEVVEMIRSSQGPLLMVIYGAGFIAIQLMFALLYLRAYSVREALELNASERLVTRGETRGFVLNVLVGLISIGVAVLGGETAVGWAGWSYALIFPLQTINGNLTRLQSRRITARGEEGKES